MLEVVNEDTKRLELCKKIISNGSKKHFFNMIDAKHLGQTGCVHYFIHLDEEHDMYFREHFDKFGHPTGMEDAVVIEGKFTNGTNHTGDIIIESGGGLVWCEDNISNKKLLEWIIRI